MIVWVFECVGWFMQGGFVAAAFVDALGVFESGWI